MFQIDTADDFVDLMDRLDDFLTATGSAFGLSYSGTGNGTLHDYAGGSTSVAETFTIAATSATNFTVTGSVTGSIGPATVGTPFSHAKLAFTITAGGTAFVSGDTFILSTAPKWTNLRRALGCSSVVGSSGNTGQFGVENLIDGKRSADSARQWRPGVIGTEDSVVFDFYESETFDSYAVRVGAWSAALTTIDLERWNGSSWVSLDSRSSLSFVDGQEQEFVIASPVAATRYRIRFGGMSGTRQIESVEFRRDVGGWNAAQGQMIWSAPGNDGDQELVLGMHALRRTDADYFNLELLAFDGFESAVPLFEQVGCERGDMLALWNDPIPYWLVANGQGFRIVGKISTQYESGYAGLLDPDYSPGRAPYLLAIGGSLALGDIGIAGASVLWDSTAFRYSNATDQHRAFPMSDRGIAGNDPQPANKHQMKVRGLDGVWRGLEGARGDSQASPPASNVNIIWPYRDGFSELDENLDGSYMLWPITLNLATEDGFDTVGRLDGVRAVTGQGLTAETPIRRGSIDWLAFPNIFRTDRDDWLAVAMD